MKCKDHRLSASHRGHHVDTLFLGDDVGWDLEVRRTFGTGGQLLLQSRPVPSGDVGKWSYALTDPGSTTTGPSGLEYTFVDQRVDIEEVGRALGRCVPGASVCSFSVSYFEHEPTGFAWDVAAMAGWLLGKLQTDDGVLDADSLEAALIDSLSYLEAVKKRRKAERES